MYFNTDGLPAMNTYRKHGYRKEYGTDRHVAAAICPDTYRYIMNNSEHYAIIKKTYYGNGKLHTEKSYDQHSTAVRPRNDHYSHLYINRKPVCIDKNGDKYT